MSTTDMDWKFVSEMSPFSQQLRLCSHPSVPRWFVMATHLPPGIRPDWFVPALDHRMLAPIVEATETTTREEFLRGAPLLAGLDTREHLIWLSWAVSYPKTNPSLLALLADQLLLGGGHSFDRDNVLQNPNLPPEKLLEYAARYPAGTIEGKALRRNPVYGLLFLETEALQGLAPKKEQP